MFEDLIPWLADKDDLNIIVQSHVKKLYPKFDCLKTWSKSNEKAMLDKIDFIITLGGDGTILFTQTLYKCRPIPPVIPFAAGSLGFLTAFDFALHRTILTSFLNDGGFVTLRMRLHARIHRSHTEEIQEYTALNEVLFDRGPSPYLTRLECYCDGVYTTTVQADGLILATPTGSTAYSLAAGGSMAHPLVPCILFTPVCPHSLSFRPMLFPDSAVIKIRIPEGRSSAWITFDGKTRMELEPFDSVQVQMLASPVPVVCRNDETSDWFHSVTNILHWNDRTQQKSDSKSKL